MNTYLENLNPILKIYFKILSDEIPEFLYEYINTPVMLKQDKISISCGTYYSKMFDMNFWYSSLSHSIAVALIIWHFTHDKKQTLAGLFHDISTPAFKHCIDFMNGDSEKQESTEELTKTLIESSPEIMELLKRDGIKVEEIADYHIYPIADNDTPMLSADRLEYTFSNGLGAVLKVWNLEEVRQIYSNIQVFEKEDGELEMGFTDIELAKKFVEKNESLSLYYMNDKRNFAQQFIADIMKIMSEHNLITVNDLYNMSEAEVIKKIEECDISNIRECFKIWRERDNVKTNSTYVPNTYCIKVKSKRRYINPLVKTANGLFRISELSQTANESIRKCKEYDFDRYLYMDFNLENDKEVILPKNKVNKKRREII